MDKDLEMWRFVSEHLAGHERVTLLVVAESSGSSPGRQGYKMAVGLDGDLCGSIGGGVMEVNLVEQSRAAMSEPGAIATGFREQVHKKNSPNASGMICSGKQTVIFRLLTTENAKTVNAIIDALNKRTPAFLTITPESLNVKPPEGGTPNSSPEGGTPNADFHFEKINDTEFVFKEKLGHKNDLYIVGGGHCALALSELMSKLDFRISIFDDRANLNTIEKNQFADEIKIIESYETIAYEIPEGQNTFIVVMTLGYKSDETVIRQLLGKDFKYFGVLGSKAKMATLMKNLRDEGFPADKLEKIRTPVGLPINSRTPEEIAVSIAAEIIAVKNEATENG